MQCALESSLMDACNGAVKFGFAFRLALAAGLVF
jgi:hypothetical protein